MVAPLEKEKQQAICSTVPGTGLRTLRIVHCAAAYLLLLGNQLNAVGVCHALRGAAAACTPLFLSVCW